MKTRKSSKKKLADRATMKRAWAIRKLTASEYGVPIKFVSMGSCILVAQGRTKKVRDVWGNVVGGQWSKVNYALLSGDCPIAIDYEEVARYSGQPVSLIRDHINIALIPHGYIRDMHGWLSVKREARPYEQGMPREIICL